MDGNTRQSEKNARLWKKKSFSLQPIYPKLSQNTTDCGKGEEGAFWREDV